MGSWRWLGYTDQGSAVPDALCLPCFDRPSCFIDDPSKAIDASLVDGVLLVNNANTTVTHLGGGWQRITKTSGIADWDADAISSVGLVGNFVVECFDPAGGGFNMEIGVSDDAAASSFFTSVDYGWHFRGFSGARATTRNGTVTVDGFTDSGGHYFLQRIGTTLFWKQGFDLASAITVDTQTGVSGTLFVDSSLVEVGAAADVYVYEPAVTDVTGTASLAFTASGTVSGQGALSGTSTLVFAPSGTVIGKGAVSGASTLVLSPTGTISGLGAVGGTSTLAFAPAGTLAGVGAVSGASSVVFDLTGSVTSVSGTITLIDGSSNLTFASSGSLFALVAIAGSTTLKLSLSGGIRGVNTMWADDPDFTGTWTEEPLTGTWTPQPANDAAWNPDPAATGTWNDVPTSGSWA
jgi:hypothetical protein